MNIYHPPTLYNLDTSTLRAMMYRAEDKLSYIGSHPWPCDRLLWRAMETRDEIIREIEQIKNALRLP